jgi:hypothetical protein
MYAEPNEEQIFSFRDLKSGRAGFEICGNGSANCS